MNHDRLEELLRSAGEVDRLEDGLLQPAHPSRLRFPTPWGRVGTIAAGLLLAAGLVALVVSRPAPVPQLAGGPTPGPGIPKPPQPISVVLAIADDGAGRLHCVRWCADVLGGRAINELHDAELEAIGWDLACEEFVPRLVVVGVEGPKAWVPTNDAEAKQLAQCLLESAGLGPGPLEPAECNSCAPDRVTMRVQTIALR